MAGFNTEEELWASFGDTGPSGYTNEDIRQARRWDPENDSNLAADMGRGLARGAIGLADALVGGADVIYNAATGDTLRDDVKRLGWRPDEWTQYLNDHDSFATQDARREYDMADGFVESAGAILANPRLLATMGAEQVPQLIPMVGAAGKAAKMAKTGEAARSAIRASAAVEGALTTGSVGAAIGDEYAEKGIDDDRRMAVASLAAGAGTAAIGRAMAGLGGAAEASIGSRIAGRGFDNIVAADKGLRKYAAGRAIATGAGEGAEEMLQSGQEQAWQNYGSYRPIGEGLGKAMGTGLVLGGAMGTAMHPLTGEPRSARDQYNFVGGSNPSAQEAKATREAISTGVEAEMSAVAAQQPEMSPQESEQIMAQQAAQNKQAMQPQGAIPLEAQPVEQAPVEQPMEEPAPVQRGLDKILREDLHYNDIGLRDMLTRTVTRSSDKKKEQPFIIHNVYKDLAPAQQQFVRAYMAAVKQAGALNRSTFVDTFAEAVDTATESVSDDPAATYAALNDIPPVGGSKKKDKLRDKVVATVMGIYAPSKDQSIPVEQLIDQRIVEAANFKPEAVVEQEAAPAEAIPTQQAVEQPAVEATEAPATEEVAPSEPVAEEAPKAAVAATAAEVAKPKEKEKQPKPTEPPAQDVKALEKGLIKAATDKGIVVKETAQTKARKEANDAVEKEAEASVERARKRRERNKKAFGFDGAFSRSTRVKDEAHPYTEKVSDRVYEDDEAKELSSTRARYRRIDRNPAAAPGAAKNISEGDTMLGNDVRRIMLDYLEDHYEGDIRKDLQSIYNGLTAKSLRAVHAHALSDFKEHYKGKTTPLSKRWLVNVLDDMVTAKEAGEAFEVPEPSEATQQDYENKQRFGSLGLPSDFVSSAEDTTVETFDLSEDEVDSPNVPTVDEIRSYGIDYKQAIRLKRRLDTTLRLVRDRKYRVMVSADADSNYGAIGEGNTARPLIHIGKAKKDGTVSKAEGWKSLQHVSGSNATAQEEAAIVVKTFQKMLDRFRAASSESSGSSAVPDALKNNFKTVIDGFTKEKTEDGKETETLAGMRITSRRQDPIYGNESPYGKHFDKAYGRFVEDSKRYHIETSKLLADLMELFPLMFRNRLKGARLTANHPVRKFLTASTANDKFTYGKDDNGNMGIKGPDQLNANEHLLHGFIGSGMYPFIKGQKGVTSAEINDLLNTTVSEDSRVITKAWREATRELGDLINKLNRSTAQKEYIVSRMGVFIDDRVLPRVSQVKADPNVEGVDPNDKYSTLLYELRGDIKKTFLNSLRAKIRFADRVPQPWTDPQSDAQKAMSSTGGKGLATSTSDEAMALRKQFSKDVVMPAFHEEFGGDSIKDVALMDRIDFYDRLLNDFYLTLSWTSPGDSGSASQNPKGVFRFHHTEDLPENAAQIDEFDSQDLWMDQWVKASGLFTDTEIRNSVKLSTKGKEAETGDIGSKYFGDLISQATKSYAKRVKVASINGIAQDAAQDADNVGFETEETKKFDTLRKAYDQQVKSFREFMGSVADVKDERVESRWDELIALIDSRMQAAAREALYTDAAAELGNKNAYLEEAKRAREASVQLTKDIKALSVQMLNRKDWGETRKFYKEGLAKRISGLAIAYEDLHGPECDANILAEIEQFKEADRALLNTLRTELNQDYREDWEYLTDNMSSMTMDDVDDVYDNGTEEEKDVIDAASGLVATIVKHNTFWDASPTSTSRGALLTLSSSINKILESPQVANNPKLFMDSLAAYLREEQAGFGDVLNEFAQKLHSNHCAKLVRQGFVPPKDNVEYWDAVDEMNAVKAELPLNGSNGPEWQAVMQAMTEVDRLYAEAVEVEAAKTFEKEVYRDNKHSLGRAGVVLVHKEAQHLTDLASDKDYQGLSPAEKARVQEKLKRRMRETLPAFSRSGKKADSVNWESYRENADKAKGYSIKEAIDSKELDLTFRTALRKLRNSLASVAGEARADQLLGMVTFKDLSKVKGTPSDVNGAYLPGEDSSVVMLRPRHGDIATTTAHEFSHFLFGNAHELPMMTVAVDDTGNIKPVGVVARQLFDLVDASEPFAKLVKDYPLGYDLADTLEIQRELLAQLGALWITDKTFRGAVKSKAPMLDKMIKDRLLGDNNGKGKPVRPPVEGLGQKDTEGEARGRVGVSSNQGNANKARLSQLSSQNAVRPRTGSVVQGQRTGLLHASSQEVTNKAADRVPLLTRVTKAVRNALPVQYRGMADTVASAAKGFFDQHLGETFLGALFTSDLANIVQKVMPSVDKWLRISKRRDAWVNARQHELSAMMNRFKEFDKQTQDQFNDLLASVTLEGVWLNKPDWMKQEDWNKHLADKDLVETREDLTRVYDSLPDEAQDLFDEVLDYGHSSQELRKKLSREKLAEYYKVLEDASIPEDEKNELKKSLDFTMALAREEANTFTKPYAPLLREGSHAVVAKSKEFVATDERLAELRKDRQDHELSLDEEVELKQLAAKLNKLKQSPNHYVVMFVESQAKANMVADKLRKNFEGKVEPFPREVVAQNHGVNLATIQALEDQLLKDLENKEDKEEARRELRHMVKVLNEMHAMNLSQYHANKSRLRRMKVAGFDKNMMNSFVTNGYRESMFYGTAMFQKDMSDAMRTMRKESNEDSADVPRDKRKRIFNEILKREELNYNYTHSEAVEKAQRVTSVFMLMTSPAFYLQNLTQSFMMTAPYLTERYPASEAFQGIFDNTRRMMEAYFNKDYRNGIEINFSKLPWMTDELLQGLREARSLGLIDIGIAQDFGNLMNQSKFATITDYLSRGARVVEMVNRVGAFTTAFNLRYEEATKQGLKDPVKAATEYACKVVQETHGDYSATNEPRFFRRGGLGLGVEKLIFQFRKFQLIQLGFMTRLTKDAFAGADSVTKSAARRALAWTLGTHFAMTGLKGTPLVATLAFVLNGMFGDEDDTDEDTLRKFIGDKGMADLLVRGVPAYLGVDVSERIGAANMFSPFPYLNANPLGGRASANEMLVAMMGPAASQVVRGMTGVSYMAEGDLFKGVEMMLPNGLTNAMRAYRYATEGYTTKNGTVTIPADEFNAVETFFQGIGLQTTTMSDRYRLQDKLIRTQERYRREENRINKEFREAKTPRERLKAQREYVALQKELAAKGFKPKPVTQLVKNAQRVEKDAKNAVGGVVSNNSNRGFLQYWASL